MLIWAHRSSLHQNLSAYSLPPSEGLHQIHPNSLHSPEGLCFHALHLLEPQMMKIKYPFIIFPKEVILWKENFFWNCFGGWCGVFLNRCCIVFKERIGFVYTETTVTLITRGYPLSTLWMLFLTQGESAWWPRNMREPQGSGCEQPSLLWFSFFIMFDIFEAELFKKYQF